MKYMALGDIRPREAQTQVDDSIQANATSSVQVEYTPSTRGSHDQIKVTSASPSSNVQSNFEPSSSSGPPTISQAIARDHPLDQIVGDLTSGVQTRSRLASFYEHYSFVSSIEPSNIDEAFERSELSKCYT